MQTKTTKLDLDMTKSDDVRELQELLNINGIHVTVDGVFGPATKHAIKRFQLLSGVRRGKKLDEKVDEKTFQYLVKPIMLAQTRRFNQKTLRDALLAHGYHNLALKPRDLCGLGSGPWARLYLSEFGAKAGQPWSAAFVCYCLKKACEAMKVRPAIGLTHSATELVKEASDKGLLITKPSNKESATGWLFVESSHGREPHVGIVARDGGDHIYTIEVSEGETNVPNGRTQSVCQRIRAKGNLQFIRIEN